MAEKRNERKTRAAKIPQEEREKKWKRKEREQSKGFESKKHKKSGSNQSKRRAIEKEMRLADEIMSYGGCSLNVNREKELSSEAKIEG